VNDVGDDSPNFEGLLGLDLDRLVVCVGRREPQSRVSLIETLDRQFSIKRGYDDVAIDDFERALHNEQVP